MKVDPQFRNLRPLVRDAKGNRVRVDKYGVVVTIDEHLVPSINGVPLTGKRPEYESKLARKLDRKERRAEAKKTAREQRSASLQEASRAGRARRSR